MILRPGAIGDLIVSLPALEVLKADYTEIWTAGANVPLIRFADCVRSLLDTGIDTVGIRPPSPALWDTLRSFDSIVSWYGTNRPEFREAVAGLAFEFHAALPIAGHELHATDYYLRQVGAPSGGVPTLPVMRQPGNYAVIHPFSGSPKKNWPLDRFREVAARFDGPVYWTAGPEEELDGATRFDSLWDLAQWIAGAAVYIGNDSGISHLAAAAGVPVVVLFGPTDPNVWAPRGPKVTVLANLDSITTSQVLAAANALRRGPTPPP